MPDEKKMPVMDIGNESMKRMERELIRSSLEQLAPLIDAIKKDRIVFGQVEVAPFAPPVGGQ